MIGTAVEGRGFTASGLKPKVDDWFDILWSGGLNNPMDAIEQVSYLLFLRLLWEKDETLASLSSGYSRLFSGEWAKRGWGNFVTLAGDQLFDALRDAIENLSNLPGLSPTGRLLFDRATLKIYDRPTLRALVQGIQQVDLASHGGHDVKGDMYEYLLSRLSISGRNGQFRTPRHIVDLVVELVDPEPHQRICDPACGTAGFLIAAYQHILRAHTSETSLARGLVDGQLLEPAQWKFLEEHAFTGFDNDANMVKIAIMNLYLHQLEKADMRFLNPITTSLGGAYPGLTFDVVLANPPFSGSIQSESILADLNLPTRATEKLFVKWFMDHLADGGRAGIIVPEGVVRGTDRAGHVLRTALLQKFRLEGVVSLPHFAFKPYASVATFVLVFSKNEPTSRVWMYRINDDGFSRDAIRSPITANDLPDVIQQWRHRNDESYVPVPSRHGWVSGADIQASRFDIAPGTYLRNGATRGRYLTKSLAQLCTVRKGTAAATRTEAGAFPLITTSEGIRTSATAQFHGPAVCVPLVSSTGHGHASIKRLRYVEGRFAAASIVAVLSHWTDEIDPRYAYYFLETHKDDLLVPLMKGAANVSLSIERLSSVQVPVPPLEDQIRLIEPLRALDDELAELGARIGRLETRRQDLVPAFRQGLAQVS